MSSKKSADETSKAKSAKRVIATKRQYFVPEHGVSVTASSIEDAVKQAAQQSQSTNQAEVGDAE